MASATPAADLPALARKLISLTGGSPDVADGDLFITGMEVNDQHGTGVLLRRLFQGEPNIISIRSRDLYDGRHDFGKVALCISHGDEPRDAIFSSVLKAMGSSTVRRALSVPYYPDDVRTAIAVKEIYGAPLCTYIMDDQNIGARGISDELMRELLSKSSLRLAISPEMRVAYEQKFGFQIWYMPPVVTGHLILSRLNTPPADASPNHGVIIGNIWGHQWLSLLRETVRGSGVSLAWYCNGQFRWVQCSRDQLIGDSITPFDPVPEEELVRILRGKWFAVLPTGTLSPDDDHSFIAQLSLPSRLVYLMTIAQVPVILLGSPRTGAANFVKRLGIGLVADYDRRSFLAAVKTITQPETNLSMRRNALLAAGRYSDVGAGEWIWASLARGGPIDRRYEDLMPSELPDLSHILSARTRPEP